MTNRVGRYGLKIKFTFFSLHTRVCFFFFLKKRMWMNPIFSTVYTDTISLAMWNTTASVMSFHEGPFFSYGILWENDFANVTCFLACVLGLPLSCATCSATHSSHLAACLCLRCWNKLVVLLLLVAADFRQTLQWTAVCSRSDAAKPNHIQTTEEMVSFLGTNSPRSYFELRELREAMAVLSC